MHGDEIGLIFTGGEFVNAHLRTVISAAEPRTMSATLLSADGVPVFGSWEEDGRTYNAVYLVRVASADEPRPKSLDCPPEVEHWKASPFKEERPDREGAR
jgi:hypothetical protein